ncbi:MAG: FmdB family zinc ribbon protein [Gemmatimonas sp.]|uniref:FmdB family zinc ribbon protein n=3 Tax=Gemmatimonas sp. TaxID=1962908 RepID=UPI0022BC8D74|nr:hypothetical protein [Gemmatimonas sp.]MCE2953832.1 hypothetical protein [Gemmatimonas sp.]MCZ8013570.1 hypothetical protein [Gemmatimonas sp.]
MYLPSDIPMPLYEYETVPQCDDDVPARFAWHQAMGDAPLTIHPVTREPVRRVISGGWGALTPQRSGVAVAAALAAESTRAADVARTHGSDFGCGSGCGCGS